MVESGAWLAMLALAGLTFSLAGAFGLTARVDPGQLTAVREAAAGGDFALRTGVLAYALVCAAGVVGVFVPARRLGRQHALRLAAGAALTAAVLSVVLFFVLAAWLGILTAAAAGVAVTSVLGALPSSHRKPWRSAGVPVALLLVVTYAAQILGGVGAGHTVLRWMAVLGCLAVLLGAVLLLVGRSAAPSSEAPTTGVFPVNHRMPVREASPVASAWACHALFFVLGAVGILSQPAVADLGFGQAGMSLIVCAVLLGWAVGFETGPTFAPGMSRPRLTAFALLTSGVLTIGAGALTELSGKAVLSGAIAFLVGLGVRAQDYTFSRRVGAGIGMAAGLLLTLAGVRAEIPLSDAAHWSLSSTEFAYEVVGAIALVAGIVALFSFGPHGIHGIGVDVVHAFRVPAVRGAEPSGSAQSSAAGDQGRTADAAAGSSADASAPGQAPTGAAPGLSRLSSVPGKTGSSLSASGAAAGAGAAGAAGGGTGGGMFIALEGGDGTGKSTQIHLLAEALRERGLPEVVTTREPGGTGPGRQLRAVLLDGEGVVPRAEALVFAADRAQHVASLVRPIVARGGIVITDRYIDSSRAYQAAGRALGDEDITALSAWATEGLVPDLTLVLDADPAVTGARISGRADENHLDREGEAFRRTVRTAFREFAQEDPARYRVIDASGGVEAVAESILTAVLAALESRGSADATAGSGAPSGAEAAPDASGAGDRTAYPAGSEASAAGHYEDSTVVLDGVHAGRSGASGDGMGAAANRAGGSAGQDGLPQPSPSEDPTRVIRAVTDSAAQPSAQRPVGLPEEVMRAARDGLAGRESAGAPAPAGDGTGASGSSGDGTGAPRASSRDRLRAQAEIERQARERLREQRDGRRS